MKSDAKGKALTILIGAPEADEYKPAEREESTEEREAECPECGHKGPAKDFGC